MMSEIRRVPVRVIRPGERWPRSDAEVTNVVDTQPAAEPRQPEATSPAGDTSVGETLDGRRAEPAAGGAREEGLTPREGEVDWRDRALRLQAEMENYRRRQQRLAQDQVEAERERLLRAYLEIVDDLERALAASPHNGGVRQGVELTHRAALQRLKKEDVERIDARGQRFDPAWHDAVSTVPGRQMGVAPETVVRVLEPGYRLGDRLLRPARVVVAV